MRVRVKVLRHRASADHARAASAELATYPLLTRYLPATYPLLARYLPATYLTAYLLRAEASIARTY